MNIRTAHGSARLTWYAPLDAERLGLLLLGHGAGGGIAAPDLQLVARLADSVGLAVGLVEQPYRVAGKRAPAPAAQLDAAFLAVIKAARAAARRKGLQSTLLLTGGRSSGARVACRTALAGAAGGVVALAFPLRPPRAPGRERPSRLPELMGAGVPVLVVQGERDPFGSAAELRADLLATPGRGIAVVEAPGADHSLRKGVDALAVTGWLARFLP